MQSSLARRRAHPGVPTFVLATILAALAIALAGGSSLADAKKRVRPPPAPSPEPSPSPVFIPSLPPGGWGDGFESGSFSTGWSWWGQGQESIWGHISIVDPRTEGVPLGERYRVGRFETTPEDIQAGRVHAKIYKSFSTGGPAYADLRTPPDVSGTYRTFYYLPTTYKVPGSSWVNMFQFKEKYRTPSNQYGVSDPLWWVNMGSSAQFAGMGAPRLSRPDAPVAYINHWNNDWHRTPRFRAVPLGRWFELRAELHQGSRIDFYLDGTLLDTAYASEYPVSPFHGSSGIEWIFGIGNYSTAANGPMYADAASYVPY